MNDPLLLFALYKKEEKAVAEAKPQIAEAQPKATPEPEDAETKKDDAGADDELKKYTLDELKQYHGGAGSKGFFFFKCVD